MNISVSATSFSSILLELIIFPNSICKVIIVKEKSIILAIIVFTSYLAVGHCQCAHLLDYRSSFFRVKTSQFGFKLSVLAMGSFHLFLVV